MEWEFPLQNSENWKPSQMEWEFPLQRYSTEPKSVPKETPKKSPFAGTGVPDYSDVQRLAGKGQGFKLRLRRPGVGEATGNRGCQARPPNAVLKNVIPGGEEVNTTAPDSPPQNHPKPS